MRPRYIGGRGGSTKTYVREHSRPRTVRLLFGAVHTAPTLAHDDLPSGELRFSLNAIGSVDARRANTATAFPSGTHSRRSQTTNAPHDCCMTQCASLRHLMCPVTFERGKKKRTKTQHALLGTSLLQGSADVQSSCDGTDVT